MTLTLAQLAGTHAAVLLAGYLAGRRAIRRKLQTSDGRRRLGGRLLADRPEMGEFEDEFVDDAQTAVLPRILPATQPTRLILPVQR